MEPMTFYRFIRQWRIKIPAFQRDYVQARPSAQKKLRGLLAAMKKALDDGKPLILDYVYGEEENNDFIPLDGQQRLTTLYLLHLYAFKGEEADWKDHFDYEVGPYPKKALRAIRHGLSTFKEEEDILSHLLFDPGMETVYLDDDSVLSFLEALSLIDEVFRGFADLAERLRADDCPIAFFFLSSDGLGNSHDLYIKMNARGKLLNPFENFKAELFKYDFVQPEDKKRIDVDYYDFLYSLFANVHPAEERVKQTDALFRYLLVDSAFRLDKTQRADTSNDGLELAEQPFRRLIALFDLWLKLKKEDEAYFQKHFLSNRFLNLPELKSEGEKTKNYLPLTTLYAFSQFAIKSQDIQAFKKFARIMWNLIPNSNIDKPERFASALDSIDLFPNEMYEDAAKWMAENENGLRFFNEKQQREESRKAKLILSDSAYEAAFIQAEEDPYFLGQTAFALALSPNGGHQHFTKDFSNVQSLLEFRKDDNDDILLHRALMVFGFYGMTNGRHRNFYFEGGNRYFDYRRLLTDEGDDFETFKLLYSNLDFEKPLKGQLQALVDGEECLKHPCGSPRQEAFRTLLIKQPCLWGFMKNNIYDDIEHSYRLLERKYLSGRYAEPFTLALAHYLGSEDHYHYGQGNKESETYWKTDNGQKVTFEFRDESDSGSFYLDGKRENTNDFGKLSKRLNA